MHLALRFFIRPSWCYRETQWLGMHKQAGTRAGNHERHTRTINVSPPTQANNATRATNGNPPTRPLYMNLTNTPNTNHTAPWVPPTHQPQTGPVGMAFGAQNCMSNRNCHFPPPESSLLNPERAPASQRLHGRIKPCLGVLPLQKSCTNTQP